MPVPYVSAPADLALHGPRVLGLAPAARIAERTGLAPAEVEDLLLDHEARGWVRSAQLAGTGGRYVTAAGRAEDERRLAAELDRAGAREQVAAAHRRFLPLNGRLAAACTDWQLRPTPADPLAANDHADRAWDEAVLRAVAAGLAGVEQVLTAGLLSTLGLQRGSDT